MKLESLNTDEFTNAPHKSHKSEATHLKSTIVAGKKELKVISDACLANYGHWLQIYKQKHPKNNSLTFEKDSTPETIEYHKTNDKLQQKYKKIQHKLSAIEHKVILLDRKDLFDEQKQEHTRLGLPTTPPLVAKIPTGTSSLAENPYFAKNATDRWAGVPWEYPWWIPKTIRHYATLSEYLKSKNIPGFTKMYASTVDYYTRLFAIANNGRFIWRATVMHEVNGDRVSYSSVRYNDRTYSTRKFLIAVKNRNEVKVI